MASSLLTDTGTGGFFRLYLAELGSYRYKQRSFDEVSWPATNFSSELNTELSRGVSGKLDSLTAVGLGRVAEPARQKSLPGRPHAKTLNFNCPKRDKGTSPPRVTIRREVALFGLSHHLLLFALAEGTNLG
jgi:hypothetical protein